MKRLCSTLALLFMVAALAAPIPAGPDVGTSAATVAIANNADNLVNKNPAPEAAIAAVETLNSDAFVKNADNGEPQTSANSGQTLDFDTGQAAGNIAAASANATVPRSAADQVPEVTARSAPNGAGAAG